MAIDVDLRLERARTEAALKRAEASEQAPPRATPKSLEDRLFDRYGPTMSMDELAGVLKLTPGSLGQRLRKRGLPVHTFREGGLRLAMTADVAAYLEERAADAKKGSTAPARKTAS